jgi:predicted aldo/keto reductase-like oxidoreductase
MTDNVQRRAFLGGLAAATAAGACGKQEAPKGAPKEGTAALAPAATTTAEMPKRRLGKTGEMVSMVGIGGSHIGEPSEEEAIRIVRTAIDRGVTFLDNCWDYHKGESETRMGKALRDGYRDKAFLMTKLDGRTKQSAAEQLDQSLKRLQTDRIDLVQVHEVIRMSDPDRVFGAGGAIEAFVEAKKAGKLRFIGFTGHKSPDIHLKMLAAADAHGFAFDAVQMPLNVMDAHYESFEKKVLPVLVQKQIGVLGMKSMGSGIILKSKTVTAVECLRYAMNLPTSVVIAGCDSVGVLEQAIATALAFKPLAPAEVAAILEKTREAAKAGEYEKFKTSDRFDGTAKNPQWLEKAEV